MTQLLISNTDNHNQIDFHFFKVRRLISSSEKFRRMPIQDIWIHNYGAHPTDRAALANVDVGVGVNNNQPIALPSGWA
ncbi:unnamed protein product [Rhizophagus irregularis]|nr:unnamed protein product [Rhizophagus irregularis]